MRSSMRCRHTVPLLVDAPGRLTWPSDVSLLLQVSSLLLVDMPGAEKLLVDPEVLRLHEGSQLSKSLLAWAAQLRRSAGQPGVLQHAGYEDTVLTRLLAGGRS